MVVGTPGRIKALVQGKFLNLSNLKHFVLDECDKMLDTLGKVQTRWVFAVVAQLELTACSLSLCLSLTLCLLQTCVATCRRFSSRPRTRSRL